MIGLKTSLRPIAMIMLNFGINQGDSHAQAVAPPFGRLHIGCFRA
jgi:hypothetical protein